MNFYKLSSSVNIEDIGVSGQVQSIMAEYCSPEQYRFLDKVNPKGKIEADINPPPLKLEDAAKKTDWLDTVQFSFACIMVLSLRFEKFLENFSLPETQVFPIRVYHRGEILNYKLLYLTKPMNAEFIDFTKSSFVIIEKNTVIDIPSFNNWDHFLKIKRSIPAFQRISLSKLVLKPKDIPYDIFRFHLLGRGIYISENLKTAIEAAGLTGMQITPIEAIKHFYVR